MRLVDDDEAQVFHRGEDGRSGPHHDRCLPRCDPPVLPDALGRRQAAVEHPDARAEPGPYPLDGLRSEGDLGHQQDRPASLVERMPDEPQVYLGLAAAGHPPQQAGRQTGLVEGMR